MRAETVKRLCLRQKGPKTGGRRPDRAGRQGSRDFVIPAKRAFIFPSRGLWVAIRKPAETKGKNMRIFEAGTTAQYAGWRHVTLQGMQLARRFRDQDGMYLYGAYELNSGTAVALEAEIVEPDASSVVNFAVIDAPAVQGRFLSFGAFRHDLDFYVLVGVTGDTFSDLKSSLESMIPVPVLCLATSLRGVA